MLSDPLKPYLTLNQNSKSDVGILKREKTCKYCKLENGVIFFESEQSITNFAKYYRNKLKFDL